VQLPIQRLPIEQVFRPRAAVLNLGL
jgi:hypothetical protein